MAYQLPADLSIGGLSERALEVLADLLEVYGSLPFIGRDRDLGKLDDRTLRALGQTLEEIHVHEARKSPAAFVQYAFRHEETNAIIENAPHHMEWHEFLDGNARAILFAPVEHGKAMPLDTLVATPKGFRAIGDIIDGEEVFGRDGRPARVVKAHPHMADRQVFRFTFDDGGRVVSDADHQWAAWTQHDLDEKRGPQVVTTAQIIAAGIRYRQGFRWKIPVAQPVAYPSAELAVHPYVLGVWLGDGTSNNSGLTFHEDDIEIVHRCEAILGPSAPVRRDPHNPKTLTVTLGPTSQGKRSGGLRGALRRLGVINNKHIPEQYLLASVGQRRELLAGLLDTDGTADGTGGQSTVSFSSSRKVLAEGCLELVRSLGYKATLRTIPTSCMYKGNRSIGAQGYVVRFTAREPVFALRRKNARLKLDGDRTRTRHRSIVAVDELPLTTTRCLTVDSPDATFVVGRDYTVTHNTVQVVGRALWSLGKDPSKRLAIISNTFDPHATKILRSIRTHIETNPRVARCFPTLKPSTVDGDPWGQASITVERTTIAKDPSIQALGAFGPVNGSRLDGAILDDILNFENTRTPEQIQKLIGWLDAEVFTRITEHGFINWIGTPWHPADPMHEIAKRAAWTSKRYSGVVNPDAPMDLWQPLWPSQFSVERLKNIYDGTTPINFARKYLCEVRMDSASRFQQAWIDNAKSLGRIHRLHDRQPHGPNGQPWPCFTGVDLGIGQGEGHDLTVLFTVALDERKRKVVCEVQAGRWSAPDIVNRIHSAVFRFNSQVYVEDNAAQAFIAQWAGNDGLPVRGFTTTAGKKYDEHYGIESLAVEMRNGGWVIPATPNDEVESWIHEMLFYTPDSHTGDRLMASWLARECARAAGAPTFRHVDALTR